MYVVVLLRQKGEIVVVNNFQKYIFIFVNLQNNQIKI
jgi:hypothetical protein